MAIYTLNDLKPEQQDGLKQYIENLLKSIEDIQDTEERKNKINEFKQLACEIGLAYCQGINPDLIKDYEPAKVRQLRLALKDGLDIETIKDLSSEEIFEMRNEKANEKLNIINEMLNNEDDLTNKIDKDIKDVAAPVHEENLEIVETSEIEEETEIQEEIIESSEDTIELSNEKQKEETTLSIEDEIFASIPATNILDKENTTNFNLNNNLDEDIKIAQEEYQEEQDEFEMDELDDIFSIIEDPGF